MVAVRAGYSMFAVQDGGQCATSATALQSFNKYGKSTACKADGEGGPSASQVYLIKGETVKFEQFVHSFSVTTHKLYLTFIAFHFENSLFSLCFVGVLLLK